MPCRNKVEMGLVLPSVRRLYSSSGGIGSPSCGGL